MFVDVLFGKLLPDQASHRALKGDLCCQRLMAVLRGLSGSLLLTSLFISKSNERVDEMS